MQAFVEDFPSEQIHEYPQAPEEYRKPEIEELEDRGEYVCVQSHIARPIKPQLNNSVAREQRRGRESE